MTQGNQDTNELDSILSGWIASNGKRVEMPKELKDALVKWCEQERQLAREEERNFSRMADMKREIDAGTFTTYYNYAKRHGISPQAAAQTLKRLRAHSEASK